MGPVEDNPYSDPANPPAETNPGGVCGVKWAEEEQDTGLRHSVITSSSVPTLPTLQELLAGKLRQ